MAEANAKEIGSPQSNTEITYFLIITRICSATMPFLSSYTQSKGIDMLNQS
ncbi:hypothetical protein [Rodentibacter caecimuris]|uniref:hypothetical protein n=1 Tax=Rodentibacter caecimuris TaxID=1796644 RepID=UPI0015C34B01